GIQEQTKRHAYLLSLIGLKQTVTIVNKMDLVNYDQNKFNEVSTEINAFLEKLGIENQLTIPTSAVKGDNVSKRSEKMPWYTGETLLNALDSFIKPEDPTQKPLRLPIQGTYHNIALGRVESGSLKQGQNIVVLPEKQKTTIKEIKVFEKRKTNATTGESIGLVLNVKVKRGQVITTEKDQPTVSSTLDAIVFWMDGKELKETSKIYFRSNTQKQECTISGIQKRINSSTLDVLEENASTLKQNEVGNVTIKTQQPITYDAFTTTPAMGRFILENQGEPVAFGLIQH
ncbi:MAG: sulfate adenylyltransferase, partial [Candidatus Diapherotrites archaeon]|nr:sulfate adenylyltransferase [Candidatus Diapherotrites archaeon]